MKKILTLFVIFCFGLNSKSYANNEKLSINAKNALLYDVTYEEMLYEKNIKEKIPNASTTKILTAIVAYENCSMEDNVEISENPPRISGSKLGLKKGDIVKMEDLMKGLLISSGNDAAIAIAEHVGGNVEKFCEMMNEKAKSLGAENTNFITPHGLDEDNHYSTAEDLLIFSKSFMKNSYLKEIANMEKTTIKIGNYEKEIYATNEMLFVYDSVNGIKTGYTSKAGRCLITSMVSGDRNLIAVVLGCDSKNHRTEDTKSLLLYGFEDFEEVDVCQKMKNKYEIRVQKAKTPKIELFIKGEKKVLLKKMLKNDLKYEYKIPVNLTAPINSGEVVGKINVYLKDEFLLEIPVKMPCDIQVKSVLEYFLDIFIDQNYHIEVKV